MLNRKLKYISFVFFILFSLEFSFAQTNTDSIYKVFNNKTLSDTIRLKAIHQLAWSILNSNPNTSLFLAGQELKFAKEKKLKKWQARAFNTIAAAYEDKSNYPEALDNNLKSLKIREEIADKQGIANSLNNIGNVYKALENNEKALDYLVRSLKLQEALGNKRGIAALLNNVGNLYNQMFEFEKSLDYQFRSLKMEEEEGDKQKMSLSLNNIGNNYLALHQYEKALEYFNHSLSMKKELGDKQGIARTLGNLGQVYFKLKQYNKALQYSTNSIELSKEIGDLNLEREFQILLYHIQKSIGNSEKALEHYERFVLLKDSIFKEENQKLIIRKEMNYEFEKKEAINKLEQDKKEAIAKEEKKNQRVILFSVIGGLLVVIVFSFFLYNRFRITAKQKSIIEKQKNLVDEKNEELNQQNEEISTQRDEIEHQKHLIEEHQKEMVDSITYAKRIQDAILPPTDLIKSKLPDTFVLYKPKDIIAGDFYWMEEINGCILIAAADCTGHGVPGAMVSVVCSNALNRAVKEFHLSDTGAILDKVTDLVLETFEKSVAEVKDGMDISLLSINKVTRQIQWSGANNPLWYFENEELKEIKADKQPIGKSDHRKPFTTHTISYTPDTTFYLFTDGYADQFGGPKGKKFKYKQFQQTLSAMLNQKPLSQQATLNSAFENWKGDLEQVDDVCIIGITL